MVNRPVQMNAYEFVVLAALRAQQLLAGCVPRLDGDHSAATMAQMEVAGGHVTRAEIAGSTNGLPGSEGKTSV
jgi:DNA-directed RNA polymerase subunit K/omega